MRREAGVPRGGRGGRPQPAAVGDRGGRGGRGVPLVTVAQRGGRQRETLVVAVVKLARLILLTPVVAVVCPTSRLSKCKSRIVYIVLKEENGRAGIKQRRR